MYVGESKRALFDRGAEHHKTLQNQDEESPMVEHHREENKDEEERRYQMEPLIFTKSNLERQAREASEMEIKARNCNLLNRRGE